MSRRPWQRPIRVALATAMLAQSGLAAAASYSVSYNPYATVNWGSTLRCQSQHHDHANSAIAITALDAAGYCAATFMTYSGDYRPQTYAAWIAAGSPNPDPGVATGWGEYRRWPPESYGAPALPMSSLRLYLPGAEEVGLVGQFDSVQFHSVHMHSLGLTQYMEGVGCSSCGNNGSAVHNDNPFGLTENQRYSSTADFIAKATALGALVTLNHPTGAPGYWDFLDPFPMSIEIFNNFIKTNDEGTCGTNHSPELIAAWDHALQVKSPRIWGVAANDWNSAMQPLGASMTACWPQITLQNRDRGKLQVLLPSYDLGAYMAAFAAGAFFAVVEDNAVKSAYPIVSEIRVTFRSIRIATAAEDETITWIGNGQVLDSGPLLDLRNLPADLVYVRAEIDDGEGRTVYTQPFSLGPPSPPPPGEPIPIFPGEAEVFLQVALLAIVTRKAQQRAARA